MNWIKVKAEHNTPELSDAQLGSLIRYQLLVAKIGRTPTDKEIRKETSIKTLLSAKESLSNIGVTLDHIESKVIEDRDHVNSKRDAGKERVRNYRDRVKCNALPKQLRNDTDKIREDKIREDNSKYIVEIINHLNVVCRTFYKTTTKKTEELINARIKEGFSVDDFKKVIDIKFKEWSTDDKFCKFLRPETLFSNKFESYLNQLDKKKKEFIFDE